ncbi:hypothetical protein TcBrA4_0053370 [Trypanosoma cruzi]|nr:hypothetical protein TcBrA4_0053370 [Trypanosoma cruzi]
MCSILLGCFAAHQFLWGSSVHPGIFAHPPFPSQTAPSERGNVPTIIRLGCAARSPRETIIVRCAASYWGALPHTSFSGGSSVHPGIFAHPPFPSQTAPSERGNVPRIIRLGCAARSPRETTIVRCAASYCGALPHTSFSGGSSVHPGIFAHPPFPSQTAPSERGNVPRIIRLGCAARSPRETTIVRCAASYCGALPHTSFSGGSSVHPGIFAHPPFPSQTAPSERGNVPRIIRLGCAARSPRETTIVRCAASYCGALPAHQFLWGKLGAPWDICAPTFPVANGAVRTRKCSENIRLGCAARSPRETTIVRCAASYCGALPHTSFLWGKLGAPWDICAPTFPVATAPSERRKCSDNNTAGLRHGVPPRETIIVDVQHPIVVLLPHTVSLGEARCTLGICAPTFPVANRRRPNAEMFPRIIRLGCARVPRVNQLLCDVQHPIGVLCRTPVSLGELGAPWDICAPTFPVANGAVPNAEMFRE